MVAGGLGSGPGWRRPQVHSRGKRNAQQHVVDDLSTLEVGRVRSNGHVDIGMAVQR